MLSVAANSSLLTCILLVKARATLCDPSTALAPAYGDTCSLLPMSPWDRDHCGLSRLPSGLGRGGSLTWGLREA